MSLLLGPSASEYHNEPILSVENHLFVLNEISACLKKQKLKINDAGLFVTITTPDQANWKIFLKSQRKGKIAKKLEQLDVYVVDESKIIGESQAAVVFGQNLNNDQTIAVKVQKPSGDPLFEQDVHEERENLAAADRLFGCGEYFDEANPEQKTYYTLMRYFPGINLLDHLYVIKKPLDKTQLPIYESKKELDDITVSRLAIKALQELMFIHDYAKLMHRDIKTANFVLNSGALKLIDLGSAKKLGTVVMQPVHSYGYLPPEQCPGQPASPWKFESDLCQTGYVIAEMLTKKNVQAAFQLQKELYISHEVRSQIMDDVFAPIDPLADPLRKTLLDVIYRCTSPDLLVRPVLGYIPHMIRDLETAITKKLMENLKIEQKRRTQQSQASAPFGSPVLRRKSVLVQPSSIKQSSPELSQKARPARARSIEDKKTHLHRRSTEMFDSASLRVAKEKLDEKKEKSPSPPSPTSKVVELSESQVLMKLNQLQQNMKKMSQEEQSDMRYTAVVTAIGVLESKRASEHEQSRHNTLRMLKQYAEKNKPSAEGMTQTMTGMDKTMSELATLMGKLKL